MSWWWRTRCRPGQGPSSVDPEPHCSEGRLHTRPPRTMSPCRWCLVTSAVLYHSPVLSARRRVDCDRRVPDPAPRGGPHPPLSHGSPIHGLGTSTCVNPSSRPKLSVSDTPDPVPSVGESRRQRNRPFTSINGCHHGWSPLLLNYSYNYLQFSNRLRAVYDS